MAAPKKADESPGGASGNGGQDFETILAELTAFKETYVVEHALKWYKGHSRPPMRYFRICNVLLILFSASVPFLATLEGLGKSVVLPVVSLSIAVLTGLLSFFNWHGQWTRYLQAQFTIENLIRIWDFEVFKAKHHANRGEAVAMIVDATEKLLNGTAEATAREAGKFFEVIQKTEIKKKHP